MSQDENEHIANLVRIAEDGTVISEFVVTRRSTKLLLSAVRTQHHIDTGFLGEDVPLARERRAIIAMLESCLK
jgi:hypothetical protein